MMDEQAEIIFLKMVVGMGARQQGNGMLYFKKQVNTRGMLGEYGEYQYRDGMGGWE